MPALLTLLAQAPSFPMGNYVDHPTLGLQGATNPPDNVEDYGF